MRTHAATEIGKVGAMVCTIALYAATAAADRFVASSGSHDGSFLTWATAATNIQAAIDAAADGETVWVTNGTYYSTGAAANNAMLNVGKGITLSGFSGNPDDTVIDANAPLATNRCLYVNHAQAIVRGITLRKGYLAGSGSAYRGAGVWLAGGGRLLDCTVESCSNLTSQGGGVYMTGSGSVISNCTIARNRTLAGTTGLGGGGIYMTAGDVLDSEVSDNAVLHDWASGGGIYLSAGTIARCDVLNNEAHNYGGGIFASGAGCAVEQCVVAGNKLRYNSGNAKGAGIRVSAGAVRDCVVTNNRGTGSSSTSGGGIAVGGGGQATNCVIAFNESYMGGGAEVSGAGSLLVDCHVATNSCAHSGGGVKADNAGLVQGCTVVSNAGRYAGGVHANGATVAASTLENNYSSSYGGGVTMQGDSLVTNCMIRGNSAGGGGGVEFYYSASRCIGSTITGNSAGEGGGIRGSAASFTELLIDRCVIVSNYASNAGSGVFLPSGTLRNSLLARNWTSGRSTLYLNGTYAKRIENCTIVHNSATNTTGGALGWNGNNAFFTNCIVYFNTVGSGSGSNFYFQSYRGDEFNTSCTAPTNAFTGGIGNTEDDPLFSDADAGDLQLTQNSPCRNTGALLDWMTGATDLAGGPRVYEGTPEMGAYELVPPPPQGTLVLIR